MECVRGVVVLANQTVPLVRVVVEVVLAVVETVAVVMDNVQVVRVLVLLVLHAQGVQGVKVAVIRVLQGAPQIVRRAVRITVAQVVHLRLDVVLSEHK